MKDVCTERGMLYVQDYYPHICDQLCSLVDDKKALLKYIKSITMYELTEDRNNVRMGFHKMAFMELHEYMQELIEETKQDEGIHWV